MFIKDDMKLLKTNQISFVLLHYFIIAINVLKNDDLWVFLFNMLASSKQRL